MSNPLANWWRSYQFHTALKQGKTRLAEQLLKKIENSGARLSLLEKLFRDKLHSAHFVHQYKRELGTLSEQFRQSTERLEELEQQLNFQQHENLILQPTTEFIDFISNTFNLIEHDEHKLQCTGIDRNVFDGFEASLVEYLQLEFEKLGATKLKAALPDANEDIDRLKSGKDPEYSLNLTPHVYFMRYFLDNVYCTYIAWFLIYKSSLLPSKLNILDIAAGPGTVAYGLALLLQSRREISSIPAMHISYYSLEQQALFQYRGLQFWRKYSELQPTATNAYFRFDTSNFLDYCEKANKLPQRFFDFIVISHCFFAEPEQRMKSYNVLPKIFANCLSKTGYVILIIQDKKLFKTYNTTQSEDGEQEATVVRKFVEDLGLNLEWYKYVTSTGRRTFRNCDFAKFALENLPAQEHMGELRRQYLGIKHGSNYALDDYIIIAKK